MAERPFPWTRHFCVEPNPETAARKVSAENEIISSSDENNSLRERDGLALS
jgi:hypothetical protein